MGYGKIPIIFPGLNSPVLHGEFAMQQRRLTEEEQENFTTSNVVTIVKPKRLKFHPLNRGWTGGLPGGRKIGPPDPVDDGL